MSEEDILQAYEWLVQYHPEVTTGTNPAFFEAELPFGYTGITLPSDIIDIIFIDPDYESMGELVNTVAHELMHAQQSLWQNFIDNYLTQGHQEIYEIADWIQREYEKQQRGSYK